MNKSSCLIPEKHIILILKTSRDISATSSEVSVYFRGTVTSYIKQLKTALDEQQARKLQHLTCENATKTNKSFHA